MSQKLPADSFEWIDGERDEGYFLFEELHELHIDLSILPKKINIEKVLKLVANLHDKNEFAIRIINSKHKLNQGLVLKKLHQTFKFKQKS